MSIVVKTSDPAGLLAAIYKEIDDNKIRTWVYDSDKDFTHKTSSEQWYGSGWFRAYIPTTVKNELHFGLQTLSTEYGKSILTYGIYHGRFIEMLLCHFDKKFDEVFASALYTTEDLIGKP